MALAAGGGDQLVEPTGHVDIVSGLGLPPAAGIAPPAKNRAGKPPQDPKTFKSMILRDKVFDLKVFGSRKLVGALF